jgi:organic radical activating enzyme
LEQLEQVRELINKDLDTQDEGMVIPGGHPELNYLHEKLQLVIEHLLQNNFEKLCNAMYRLDVSERKFHEVLTGSDVSEVCSRLADLVIEREMQKVKTREMYRRKEL